MISKDIRDVYLVDELQLGQRLNESLQDGNQTDFNLMCAMLSPDVTDAAWTRGPDVGQAPEDLRAKFYLLPEERKYAEEDDFYRSGEFSEMLQAEGQETSVGQSQIFFSQCLRRDPLTPFKHDLAPEVYAEFAPLKKEKLRRKFAGEIIQYETFQGRGQNLEVLKEIGDATKQIEVQA